MPLHGAYKVVTCSAAIRDVPTPRISWHDRNPFRAKLTRTPRHRGSRTLPATTEHAPWEGTNNGHPTMILTGMTHGDYQPALHPPPSDLRKISPLVPNHRHHSPPWHLLQHQAWAVRRHKHWPPPHHTRYYDPWPLPTGSAPTTLRSGREHSTCVHSPPTTTKITPLRAP